MIIIDSAGSLINKLITESDGAESEIDYLDIDDDMNSDKDKYSTWYGSSRNHYNFNEFPDKRVNNKKNHEFELEIEGPTTSINWWCSGYSNTENDVDRHDTILNKALDISMQIGSFAKQSYTSIIESSAVTSLKNKFKDLIWNEETKEEIEDNHTVFSNENTVWTLPHSRKQSIAHNTRKFRKFYDD